MIFLGFFIDALSPLALPNHSSAAKGLHALTVAVDRRSGHEYNEAVGEGSLFELSQDKEESSKMA
jgi:hypothetical protein